MSAPGTGDWRWLHARGLDQLSPPEAEHVLLELAADRHAYIRVWEEIVGWPRVGPIGRRVPSADEVEALRRLAGRWRVVVALDDERALRTAAGVFDRVCLLNPLYDSGEMLYAAWHDPRQNPDHAAHLAQQAGRLVSAAPLLRAGLALLVPDHLPGSWDPRPAWRRPRPDDDEPTRRARTLRQVLVVLYWADRLDAVACAARPERVRLLEDVLGPGSQSHALRLPEAPSLQHVARRRAETEAALDRLVRHARRLARRRARPCLAELGCALEGLAEHTAPGAARRAWRLQVGEPSLPDPALLIRRAAFNLGADLRGPPPLPPTRLRRRPLVLVAS